jgi:maltose O-acetyltransferase
MKNNSNLAKGNFFKRLITLPLLYLAWFSPHKNLRVFFHRLRGVKIGKNVEIGYFCIIGNVNPDFIKIGDNVVITARVTILEHDNSYYYTHNKDVISGYTHIKNNVFVGIGSVIMPNIQIGENTIIGSLSFVNKSIVGNVIAAGCPAKIIDK